MYVPVPVSTQPQVSDTDHRDLQTAIRLLSGYECKRDASQAQVLLVGLTESSHADVAADSRAIMKAGLSRGWFDTTAPKIYDLEMLAETSLKAVREGQGNKMQKKLMLVLLLGLSMFLALGLFYFFQADEAGGLPEVNVTTIAILIAAFAALAVGLKMRVNR